MKGENFEFFRKYTTVMFNGSAFTFYSDPWEVTPYNRVAVEVFPASHTPSATYAAELQESNDLETWSTVTSAAVSTPGTMTTLGADRTMRYVRLVLHMFTSTTVPAYCVLWAKGVARNAL